MKIKKTMIWASLAAVIVSGHIVLTGWGADAPKKEPPPLPKPPAKVFEDGTPWKAVDQEDAMQRAHEVPDFVRDVLPETLYQRRERLAGNAPSYEEMLYRYRVLDSPLLKQENDPSADLYTPVRFMHMKHATVVEDCLVCHHHRPADAAASETVRCSACHQDSLKTESQERPGLKGAYHQRCMECHKERNKGPVGCTDCHGKNVPDHTKLVQLPENPTPFQVTQECLRCHEKAGEDMLSSAHWLWRGPSPFTAGAEKRIDLGKGTNTINNFCVALTSNWPRCTSCHAGYGWKDATFDFTDTSRMDCLVCHDTTQTYAKVPTDAGMPYPQLDLRNIAQNVGKPSRKTCGDCHFQGGGGDAVKHGDMNSILYYPSRSCDVHMGGMDFQCHECHKTRNHKIAGRSLSLPVAEGSRSCQDCHTAAPHKYHAGEGHEGHNLLNHHLNRHVEHIACVTCHSPVYSKCVPSKTWWDWSTAGDKERKPKKDKYGMPDYSWMKGDFAWGESVKPSYAWYNGAVKRHLIGDKISPDGATMLTEPVGKIHDASSKIYPFKLMKGRQMADAENRMLIVPHLFGPEGYWSTLDWQKSFEKGMKAAGLPYSGKYEWVDTVMYWGLTHEIMPAKNALGCTQCHASMQGEKTCGLCHQDNREVDFKKLSSTGTDFEWMKARGRDVSSLVGVTDYIDFKALGYKGDPILVGGRFKKLPLGAGQSSGGKAVGGN
jgi:octaheme c-type cytochrome (tetrathionate reductase family)